MDPSRFDGDFLTVTPGDLRAGDFVLFPARQLPARFDPESDRPYYLHHLTSTGRVCVFRPSRAAIGRGCPDCRAEPDEPCDPLVCLSLLALDDAAKQIWPDGEPAGTAVPPEMP